MEAYHKRRQAFLFLLPTMLAVGAFFYWPLIRAFQLSRQKTIGFGVRSIPHGWKHFTYLATDPGFQYSVGVSFLFAFIVVVASMVIAMLVSLLIYRISEGQSFYLVAGIFTYALSFAVTATIWKTLFNPQVGLFTEILQALFGLVGVSMNLDYATNPVWAWIFATSGATWKLIGYNIIFMVAALGNIPETINETARLDGIGWFQMLTKVYIPMISPTLAFLAIINTVSVFFLPFPIIEVLQGGPGNTLNIIIYDVYQTFSNGLIGRASAKSLVMFVILGGLTGVQLYLSDRFAHYGGARNGRERAVEVRDAGPDRVRAAVRTSMAPPSVPPPLAGRACAAGARYPVDEYPANFRIVQTSLVGIGADGLSNYVEALTRENFDTFLVNSFIMGLAIGIGKVGISLLAAMALVFYDIKYKRLILDMILFTLALPVPVRIVPIYELMVQGGRRKLVIDTSFYSMVFDPKFVNTMSGLILPYMTSATSILILRQHSKSIPDSMVEQAKLDAVGPIKFLVSVLVPMSRSMIAGLFAISFIWGWNQYLWPLIIINDQKTKGVIQTGLAQLAPQAGKPLWGIIMAGAMTTIFVPLVLMVILRDPMLETISIQQK